MSKQRCRLTTSLVVALAMLSIAAFSAATAQANEVTLEPAGATELIASAVTIEGGGISARCSMTLDVSFLAGPIRVAAGNQIGEVTRVITRRCENAEAPEVLLLPWKLTINALLPASAEPRTVRGLLANVIDFATGFSWFWGLFGCLWVGTEGGLIPMTATGAGETRYTARSMSFLSAIELPLALGSGCPATVRYDGTFTFGRTTTFHYF